VALRRDIEKAKKRKPDAIIVFTHWGIEYESLPSKKEKDLTEFCFQLGVQVVIGSHPHVLQPMEWRKETNQFVAYSLGNFVSGQRKQYTDGGALAYLELKKVHYGPDSTATTIDSAGYYLDWVYRTVDRNKDYYVLPAAKVENDSTSFFKDGTPSGAFETFVKDSRAHYQKHNQRVLEMTGLPKTYAENPKDEDL
jgi:poly-gamma-glutamate synthesis protein (capsule biosynthesis protein)